MLLSSYTVGMIGEFNIVTLVGVPLLALFVFGSICAVVYTVFISITHGIALLKDNRSPMRAGEWWRR